MPEPQLSTMWGQKRAEHIRDFFRLGEEAGFSAFELGHHVRAYMLDGAKPGEWRVLSIHAPCPNPSSLRGLSEEGVLPSATDEGKRKMAVAYIRQTIDLAAEWGAKVVVVHLGRVDVEPSIEIGLRDMYRQGQKDSPEYKSQRQRLVNLRSQHREANFSAASRSLAEIAEYASPKGIAIGLENRFYYQEIPSFEEMGMLLGDYPSSLVSYWHDTGHAQVLEHLGFTSHIDCLRAYAPRMLGVHLHDVQGIKDHRVPGAGGIDFPALAPYFPEQALRVCEFGHDYTAEEIAQGREHLRQAGCLG
ncbi:MAG: sugar phosphate isomerase/epimerase [Chloroflexi bacterium]|nr:sugar phosphate isomerase/epimerase [Chloroflexota bacterium]